MRDPGNEVVRKTVLLGREIALGLGLIYETSPVSFSFTKLVFVV